MKVFQDIPDGGRVFSGQCRKVSITEARLSRLVVIDYPSILQQACPLSLLG